jgi:hypothetical protein
MCVNAIKSVLVCIPERRARIVELAPIGLQDFKAQLVVAFEVIVE